MKSLPGSDPLSKRLCINGGNLVYKFVTAPDGIIPTAANLEAAYLPDAYKITRGAFSLVRNFYPKDDDEGISALYRRNTARAAIGTPKGDK